MTDAIETSQAGMLQRDVVVVRHHPPADLGSLEPDLHAHHEYVTDLEAKGLLLMAGPLPDTPGASIWILTEPDTEVARDLAAADPYVAAGLRTTSIERWRINAGAIDIQMRCSDQTFTLGRATPCP